MNESKGHWIKEKTRLFSWNRCSGCGHRMPDTIWGEEETPEVCPKCGLEMVVPQRVTTVNVAVRSRCLLPYCAGMKSKDDCIRCGFNEMEKARRMKLPWSINEQGMLYKNIHIAEEKT